MKSLGIISLLVVVAACVADPSCTSFSCSTQLPVDRLAEQAELNNPPFVIITSPRTGFVHGDDIYVEIATKEGSGMKFSSFILQAQVPSDNSQMGSFESLSQSTAKVDSCEGQDDTLVNNGHEEVEYVTANWKPPADMDISKTVEFDATVQTANCSFWMIHSVLIRFTDPAGTTPPSTNVDEGDQDGPHDGETDSESSPPDDFEQPRTGNEGEGEEDQGTGEDSNEAERLAEEERLESIRRDEEGEALDRAEEEAAGGEEDEDDHGRKTEENLLQQHLEYLRQIDDEENQAGENSIAIELRHEKELHEQEIEDERAESERLRAEEERVREERIRLEIIDKEEYDAWLAQQEREGEIDSGEVDSGEIEVGDGSGGASMVHSVGILSAVLAVLVATLW